MKSTRDFAAHQRLAVFAARHRAVHAGKLRTRDRVLLDHECNNVIAIFSVEASTGLLTSVVGADAGENTAVLCDPLVIFRIDAATGKLVATGETIAVATPTTIAFR